MQHTGKGINQMTAGGQTTKEKRGGVAAQRKRMKKRKPKTQLKDEIVLC